MTDQELKGMADLPEILSSGHDDYDNSLRVAEIIKELKRHREAVKHYHIELLAIGDHDDNQWPTVREIIEKGDEILKGERG